MVYIVSYMYVYDDYKDAGASTKMLGAFTDKDSAYQCAIQQYCKEIQDSYCYEEDGLKDTLEEHLFGAPQAVYEALHSWRDSIFVPEFTRDKVGPMVFVERVTTLDTWDLDGYLAKQGLKAGGKLKALLDDTPLPSMHIPILLL